ncbi:MAG: hypothetical protein HDT27_10485 [Subdoligranulum sp.]|nr:hypothetical protein [Subdoligranulum sp.]
MQQTDSKVLERYFRELSLALGKEGFSVKEQEDDGLSISQFGEPVGTARFHSIIFPREGTPRAPWEIQEKALSVIRNVSEYMRLMEAAPLLKATGLEGDYRILGQFNDVVLAGHFTRFGVQFITWDWNQDHTAVSGGCYMLGKYEEAKQDFAVRSGLVPQEMFFTPDQLKGLDVCCASALAHDDTLTFEQGLLISELREQLREIEPSLNSPEPAAEHADAIEQQGQTM